MQTRQMREMWNYEWRSRAFVLSVELGNYFIAVTLQHCTSYSFWKQPLQIRVSQYDTATIVRMNVFRRAIYSDD